MTERLLVVGGGQAAADLVTGLVSEQYAGEITVVTNEPHAPYQRPPLSKAYLLGERQADALALRTPQYFVEHCVRLIVDDEVRTLRSTAAGGGVAQCASGLEVTYDRLVLATGAKPRMIPELAHVDGVFALRTVADADRLAPQLVAGRHVVVIGGGFIGLEVAAAARQRECRVTVIEAAPQILGRVVDSQVADHVADLHRVGGISIVTGRQVVEWQVRDHHVRGLVLDDGTSLSADVIVVGIGAVPRTRLAAQLELACDSGIVVDGQQRASDRHTLAIGDCAQGPDRSPAGEPHTHVRLESVDHATQSAAAAVATILGKPTPEPAPPWFWSDQGDVRIQVVGLARPTDQAVTRRDGVTLLVAYFRADELVAAVSVNAPGDFMGVRKAISHQVAITPEEIADPSLKLSKLVAQRLRSIKNPSSAT